MHQRIKEKHIFIQKIDVKFEYTVYFCEHAFSPDNRTLSELVLWKALKWEKVSYKGAGNFNNQVDETEKYFYDNPNILTPIAPARQKIIFFIEEKVAKTNPDLKNKIENYCEYYKNIFNLVAEPYIFPGGENTKIIRASMGSEKDSSFSTITRICKILAEQGMCRHSFVGIIGGGAFLDIIGLAASLVHRGLRQIRFPTTTLSQADSGVGVKNGMNIFGIKNFIGTFAPPVAVINDSVFLDSLSYKDWIAGVAEAFKVALIKDADFFFWLVNNLKKIKNRNKKIMNELIYKSAMIHMNHIKTSGDPFEFGSARPLDFGHWFAHYIESASEGKIGHGEAVATGIVLDTFYASELNLIQKRILNTLKTSLHDLGFPLWYKEFETADFLSEKNIANAVESFREHLGGQLYITLPDGLGKKREVNFLDINIIKKGFEFIKTQI